MGLCELIAVAYARPQGDRYINPIQGHFQLGFDVLASWVSCAHLNIELRDYYAPPGRQVESEQRGR
jgi:hypothetical protein